MTGVKHNPYGARIAESARRVRIEGIGGRPLEPDPGSRRGPAIDALVRHAGLSPGMSWCGALVAHVAREGGITEERYLRSLLGSRQATAYAVKHPRDVLLTSFAGRTRSERDALLAQDGVIEPGDVIAWRGHLGTVVNYDPRVGKLVTLEGNTAQHTEPDRPSDAPPPTDTTSMRAMFRTYYLRTDVKGHETTAEEYWRKPSRGGQMDVLRYVKAAGTPEARPEAPAGERTEQRPPVPSGERVGPSSRVRPQEGTGPARWDAGVPASAEQMGSFANALDAAAAAAEVDRQLSPAGEHAAFRSRGVEGDFRNELSRLQTTRNEFTNWQTNHRDLATDRAAVNAWGRLQARITQLSDYLTERRPTAGLSGDSAAKILFDGSSLLVHGADTPTAPRDYRLPAASGRGDVMSTSRTDVAAQKMVDRGPIPEGTYWVDLRQWSAVVKPWERSSWGPERLTIHPFGTTETFGRGGTFIHGGAEFGSAGCVDVVSQIGNLRAELGRRVPDDTKRVQLVVDYSQGRERGARARLDSEKREEISSSLDQRVHYNQERGFGASQLAALERSFGMRVSEDAKRGAVSEALTWNVAAWQQEAQRAGLDTGGVDAKIGPKTERALRRAGLWERAGEPTESSSGARELDEAVRRSGNVERDAGRPSTGDSAPPRDADRSPVGDLRALRLWTGGDAGPPTPETGPQREPMQDVQPGAP